MILNENNQFLGTEPVGKLMGRYAVPCVISLLVGALYNIVDQIFIANAEYLGSYGNAANTVVFPLTVVALAVAVMIGDGCCAFVSMSLGRGEQDAARRSVGNAVVLSVAGSLIRRCISCLPTASSLFLAARSTPRPSVIVRNIFSISPWVFPFICSARP
mgnify:CR=1 FL=1